MYKFISVFQKGATFVAVSVAGLVMAAAPAVMAAGWEPTKPVEFVIPAGTGGGDYKR